MAGSLNLWRDRRRLGIGDSGPHRGGTAPCEVNSTVGFNDEGLR
jgi:hypothetical protein